MRLSNAWAWLIPRKEQSTLRLPIPATAAEIGDYKINFERASAFTRQCGFDSRKVTWQEGVLTNEFGGVIEKAYKKAGVQDSSMAAAQCLKWCHYLAPHVEWALGAPVWLTVGQIWNGDRPVFNPTWDDLRRWGRHGIQMNDFAERSGINLHAWWTLNTGEIVEPTFLSSIALANRGTYGKFSGATAWGHDPDVLPFSGHRYFPMAIGRKFVESLSKKSITPLLAKNAEELHEISVGFGFAS